MTLCIYIGNKNYLSKYIRNQITGLFIPMIQAFVYSVFENVDKLYSFHSNVLFFQHFGKNVTSLKSRSVDEIYYSNLKIYFSRKFLNMLRFLTKSMRWSSKVVLRATKS